MKDSAHAHDAGLEGHIQLSVHKPVIAQCLPACPQSHDLCMGCGVMTAYRAVAAATDYTACLYQHRTHRHFTGIAGFQRLIDSLPHEKPVTGYVGVFLQACILKK
jgi:hypothetical protein